MIIAWLMVYCTGFVVQPERFIKIRVNGLSSKRTAECPAVNTLVTPSRQTIAARSHTPILLRKILTFRRTILMGA